jgi:hypothetical protein
MSSFPLVIFSNLRAGNDFADLYSTLNTIKCYDRIGLKVYSAETAGYCRNYIYGSDLLTFSNFLNLNPGMTFSIGIAFMLSVCVTFAIVLASSTISRTQTIYAIVLFFSPGISLLFERGNIDALIFVFLVLSGYLALNDKYFASISILALLSILKFYTFPCLIIYLFLQRKRCRVLFGVALLLVSFSRIVLSLSRIEGAIPEGGYAQFGAKIIGNYSRGLGFSVSSLVGSLFGYVSLFLITTFLMRNKQLKNRLENCRVEKSDLVTPGFFCGVVFLSCYILGLNYDYRLVFLLPFSIWLYKALKLSVLESKVFLLLNFFGIWLSAGFGSYLFPENLFWQRYVVNAFQALGDISLWILIGISLALVIQSFVPLSSPKSYRNWANP